MQLHVQLMSTEYKNLAVKSNVPSTYTELWHRSVSSVSMREAEAEEGPSLHSVEARG